MTVAAFATVLPIASGSAVRYRRKGPALQIVHSRGQDGPALRSRSKRSRCISGSSRLSWLPMHLLQSADSRFIPK